MKPKKKPILLISLAVTLVLVVFGVNLANILREPGGGLQTMEAPNQETIDKMRERQQQAVSSGDRSAARLKQASKFSISGAVTVANPKMGEVPDVPSVLIPTRMMFDPEFENDSTSSHWYKDDSYLKEDARKRQSDYNPKGTK
ncbi:MAG: hypothetical protein WD716_01965 [Fimbriimonadaceae bacterium]